MGSGGVPPGRDPPVRAETATRANSHASPGSSCRAHGHPQGATGAPGVGKTALADELRPAVTGRDGWFVAGYRRDLEFDAANQALRALGRLLPAEPDEELAEVCARILAAVGANAALLTATAPEFAALPEAPPDAGDPLTAQRAAVAVLRAVASRKRPVVVFLDDPQWTGRTPLGFADLGAEREAGRSNRLLALRSRHRRPGEGDPMDDDRQLQVSRIIDAPPERIFAVLADPARHRELDGAGMLRGLDSGDAPITAAGQAFVMNMNQDGIGDYQMRSEIVVYEADRRIGWAPAIHPPGALAHIIGELDPSGHTYVWELEPAGDGRTKVTHTYDWSGVRDQNALNLYPRVSKEQMEGSLDRVAAAVA